MKKLIVSASVIALFAAVAAFPQPASAQAPAGVAKPAAAAAAPGKAATHKVGLIDMAYVFKNYKKFEVLREDLKQEITSSDGKAKTLAERIKDTQAQMKKFKEGSPDYVKQEKELLALSSDFEAFRKGAQRDLMRREADIYKTIYLEVMDTINKYAAHYEYTLIMRFTREGVETDDDPSKVIQGMNRQVVFHRGEDDITDSVLDYLNRRYLSTAKAPTTGAATPR